MHVGTAVNCLEFTACMLDTDISCLWYTACMVNTAVKLSACMVDTAVNYVGYQHAWSTLL